MDNSNYFSNLHKIPRSIEYIDNPKVVNRQDVNDKDKALLDLIFSRDPVNGIPCGDLAIYLGDKANTEVKRFIEMNLLQPSVDSGGVDMSTEMTNKIRSSITDDDIARFSRGRDDSKEEYAVRMRKWFDDERECRRKEKDMKRFEDEYNRAKQRLSSGAS